VRAVLAKQRIPNSPLSGIKSANRLIYILARLEADAAGEDEALLQNEENEIIEASASNFFWIKNNVLHTAPLSCGVLPGITREIVLAACPGLRIEVIESPLSLNEFKKGIDAAFLTNSAHGITTLSAIGDVSLPDCPMSAKLLDFYRGLVESETA
jgi:4-amino-4-deoxychorismate lyase